MVVVFVTDSGSDDGEKEVMRIMIMVPVVFELVIVAVVMARVVLIEE